MKPLKCLSVRSPWAELIEMGRKTIELRTWPLAYRGLLVIVSTASPETSAAARAWDSIVARPSRPLCVVEMFDCRPATLADADAACTTPTVTGTRPHFAWLFRLVKVIDIRMDGGQPYTMRGQLSIYPPPKFLSRQLKEIR